MQSATKLEYLSFVYSVQTCCAQARAWASWKDEVVLGRLKRSVVLDCIKRLQTGLLGRLFRAWHASALELADLRNKARVVIIRLSHRAKCIAFATWVDWNYQKHHQRCTSATIFLLVPMQRLGSHDVYNMPLKIWFRLFFANVDSCWGTWYIACCINTSPKLLAPGGKCWSY